MLKYKLLSMESPRRFLLFLVFVVMLITVIYVIMKVYTFDSLLVTGIISCDDECSISITLPYDKIDSLNNSPFIIYNNQNYDIWEISYGEPYLNLEVAYEDVIFKTNLKTNDRLINFKILSNRQRIIEKLKRIILER